MFYHIIRTCQGTKRELRRALTVADNAVHNPGREGTGRLFLCLEDGDTRKPTCCITLRTDRRIAPDPMVVCSRTLAAGKQLPGDSTNGITQVKGITENEGPGVKFTCTLKIERQQSGHSGVL